jgi:hypothetical protein
MRGAFMNALHVEGFVLLGGPLEGTSDVLLIVQASDANEIHARLSIDSWTSKDLLRIKQIAAWTIRLGYLMVDNVSCLPWEKNGRPTADVSFR